MIGVKEDVRQVLNSACIAAKANQILQTFRFLMGIRPDCADAQSDLSLCCSHIHTMDVGHIVYLH